ncbi:MAG: DUF2169 domain-containing protein [Byssovorax sp.]
MDVVSACPLPVASLRWQTPARGASMAVVCKATYQLEPVESSLAREQPPPSAEDVFRRDDPAGSLRMASDLVPFKRRAEVLLVGHAYAPRREPVRSLRVRLLVGEVDKAIEIFADRAFTLEGQLREGPRFTQMPLVWKRAAGGPGTSNPAGVRLDAPPDAFGQRPLPNLQPPGLHVTSPDDIILPVGFGPIAPTWPGRWDKLGRHASTWDPLRFLARPLPDDLDPAYFNVAPPDQQLDAIRPNERIVLENLHPEHERLVTSLAPATPRARVEWAGGGGEDVRFRCDTIWIDTDQGVCSLTWRAQIPLDHPDRQGRVTVTLAQGSKSGEERRRWNGMGVTAAGNAPRSGSSASLPFSRPPSEAPPRPGSTPPPRLDRPPEVAPPPRLDRPPEIAPPPRLDRPPEIAPPPRLDRPAEIAPPARGRVDVTQDAPIQGAMPALPFRVGRSPLAGSVLGWVPDRPGAAPPPPQPAAALPFAPAASSPQLPVPAVDPRAGLPFAPAAPAQPPAPQLDFDDDTSDEITHDHLPWLRAEPELPFSRAPIAPPVAQPIAPPPAAPAVMPSTTGTPLTPLITLSQSVTPLSPASPVVQGSPVTPMRGAVPLDDTSPVPAFSALPPAPVVAPAPPPMLGPLATPEMLAAEAAPGAEPAPAAEDEAASSLDEAPTPMPEPPSIELPLARYPLERCARIAADIARRKPEAAAILEEHDLAPAMWTALDKHWSEAIAAEMAKGKSKLLKAYDAAYVGRLEEVRGLIEVRDYARLSVATERGTVAETLAALGLPKGAVLRIQRLWLAKIAADPALGAEVRAAVAEEREA